LTHITLKTLGVDAYLSLEMAGALSGEQEGRVFALGVEEIEFFFAGRNQR
jgi:hypothetical protein